MEEKKSAGGDLAPNDGVTTMQHHFFQQIKPYSAMSYITQCVKSIFLVQKLQILEKLAKWLILIFVSKLTIFSGKTFEIFEFFVPKLVKNFHFMV